MLYGWESSHSLIKINRYLFFFLSENKKNLNHVYLNYHSISEEFVKYNNIIYFWTWKNILHLQRKTGITRWVLVIIYYILLRYLKSNNDIFDH